MPWTKIAVDNAIGERGSEVKPQDKRLIDYSQAIREALVQAMKKDLRVFLMGELINDPAGVFGSTLDLHKEFGDRVMDTPIAENGITGIAIGAAICGMRPVLIHMRMDFLPLSFDQIFNHAAKISYMSAGKVSVPLVIRSIIGRGWGSAAQHSQSLHALFVHVPGIKVVMPSSPYDVKGLLLSSIADPNPVIFIEHRWLYGIKGHVPEKEYLIPIGRGFIRRPGKDVTVLAFSWMVEEALKASQKLAQDNIDIEIIDPRSLNPLDEEIIVDSVRKTGRLVIADLGWQTGGIGQIILGRLHNKLKTFLKSDVQIIALPDAPTPASAPLEEAFYKNYAHIMEAVKLTL